MSRTTSSGNAGCFGSQNTGNSIGEIPSVKLHAPPGGGSSISIGGDINTSAAPTIDRSDAAARLFLSECNQKMQTQGKLGVRDFHLIASFPLFEHTYNQNQISRLRYADKVSATPQFLKSLNTQFGAVPSAPPPAAAPMPPVPEAQQAPWGVAPEQVLTQPVAAGGSAPYEAPLAPTTMPAQQEDMFNGGMSAGGVRTASRGGGAGGMQNVGNSIGDIPSVKLHAPPGGSSSIAFGAEINTNAAPSLDRSDSAALAFLSEINSKHQTQGKLGVRDFHIMGQYPLFEQVYSEFDVGSMSYADKVNSTANILKKLNSACGSGSSCTPMAAQNYMPAPTQQQNYMPAPTQQQNYMPAPTQQQNYMPAPTQQQNYMPAPTQQQNYMPAPTQQQNYMPAPTQQSYGAPTQSFQPNTYEKLYTQPSTLPYSESSAMPQQQEYQFGPSGGVRTASRGGGAGGMQNVGNSIGDIPSVKLHAPPGGASQIAFG